MSTECLSICLIKFYSFLGTSFVLLIVKFIHKYFIFSDAVLRDTGLQYSYEVFDNKIILTS